MKKIDLKEMNQRVKEIEVHIDKMHKDNSDLKTQIQESELEIMHLNSLLNTKDIEIEKYKSYLKSIKNIVNELPKDNYILLASRMSGLSTTRMTYFILMRLKEVLQKIDIDD